MRADQLRKVPVPELHRLFLEEARDLPSGGLNVLKEDSRAGARAVAEKIERRNHQAQAEGFRRSSSRSGNRASSTSAGATKWAWRRWRAR